ncbi:sensor histidine kinase [Candidatus Nitrosacidococcus tergens]|uniref:histidine kinase n=1 Tax=Candidatus Nitrosacidococcus tergens TaxID=553981 RepID=A0A7G1QA39_9GAMM|nr:sensor histidine kinase [Candidatus Nitrosacidococcus tergens]CAB1276386.1 ATP-binding region ATPase domain protein [Candidatus Nitrosacidococcus tergens]
MISMKRQLGISLFISLFIPGVLMGEIAIWWLDQRQRTSLITSLHSEAINILAALHHLPESKKIYLNQQAINPIYHRPFSRHYFTISSKDMYWRSRSLWDFQLEALEEDGLSVDLVLGPQKQKLLRYQAHYQIADQPVTIVVALDYAPQLEDFTYIKTRGILIWIFILIFLALLQQWLIRRGLTPLNLVHQQLKQFRDGQRTMLDTNVVQELKPLVDEVNRLQDYTERQLRRSRHAVGDLSHGLKTPLSVIRNQCQTQLQGTAPTLAKNMSEQIQQMESSIKRALGRARIAAELAPKNRFIPTEDIPLLFRTLRQAYDNKVQLKIEGKLPEPLPFDRDDMLELLGNLLDNACKWANQSVNLTLESQPKGLMITVTDDGPGIDPIHQKTMLERGTRLDQQVPGQGFGLGIVNDLVEAYEGELFLNNKLEGGLQVRVFLPLPSLRKIISG